MQRTMHNLITLWKYLHREDYLQQLRDEYEDLESAATRASTLDEHNRLNRQRDTVAAEIRSLAQPLRLRMLWAPLPQLSQHDPIAADVTKNSSRAA